jgi:hypothetical protein
MKSKIARLAVVPFVALLAAAPAQAAPANEDEGWPAFGHALTLVQMFVRLASQSEDPQAGLAAVDDILGGRNTEANRAIAGLFDEATADMPAEYRGKVASIGRDLVAMARREAGKPASLLTSANASADRALQARKDLTAMGLSYHDPKQFLDAVSRDDMLAVELFIAGRGVNFGATDWRGRNAVEIARANGNAPLAELLARNLPAAR